MLRIIRRFFYWLRWGRIGSRVKGTIEGAVCEIEYYDCRGNVIGYWAYGGFDPSYPYQGQV